MRAVLCRPGRRRAALLGIVTAALLVAIAAAFSVGLSEALDRQALFALRRHAAPWLTGLMLGVTLLGSWPVVAAGVLCFAWTNRRRPRHETVLLVTACIGAGILSLALKTVFQRPRPDLVPPLVAVGGFSFPSGHALLSLVFYGTLGHIVACRVTSAWRSWLLRLAAGVMIVLVGVSRVYLGVHYFTDVLAGYVTAVAWVSAMAFVRAAARRHGDPASGTSRVAGLGRGRG